TITVAEGQDTVVVAISVPIQGAEEVLNAGMEMSAGGVVLFSGTVQVTAKAGVDVTSLPPELPLVWVGPGSEATRVHISQTDTTIRASAHLALQATAFDAGNNEVHNPTYEGEWRWNVIEPTLGTMPATGGEFVGAGVRGVAHVRVWTPNQLEDTVALALVPAATQVVVISGNNQSANAGSVLPSPAVVEVRAADNLPVPNTVVKFSAVNGGSVSPDSTMTEIGRASC